MDNLTVGKSISSNRINDSDVNYNQRISNNQVATLKRAERIMASLMRSDSDVLSSPENIRNFLR